MTPNPVGGSRRATIAAIAEEAGVSIATVSKVLNGRGDVAPDTRERVEASLERHSYRRRGKRKPPSAGHIELGDPRQLFRRTDLVRLERPLAPTMDYYAATAPHSEAGGYINFMAEDDQHRIEDNYKGNYDRLVDVKRKYDPNNVFRVNQNIRP